MALEKEAEWYNLAGEPTFEEIGNGRYRCSESGHELVGKEIDTYKKSKHCRIGMIDHAISLQKSPLNIFIQNHLSRSKLICKLTGDTINKTEKHMWMHLNGKRFLKKLEEKEMECVGEKKEMTNSNIGEKIEKEKEEKSSSKKKKKKKKEYMDICVDHKEDDLWISRGGKHHPNSAVDSEAVGNGEEEKEMECVGEKKEVTNSKVGEKVEKEKEEKLSSKKKKKKKKEYTDVCVDHKEDDLRISSKRKHRPNSAVDLEAVGNGEGRVAEEEGRSKFDNFSKRKKHRSGKAT